MTFLLFCRKCHERQQGALNFGPLVSFSFYFSCLWHLNNIFLEIKLVQEFRCCEMWTHGNWQIVADISVTSGLHKHWRWR